MVQTHELLSDAGDVRLYANLIGIDAEGKIAADSFALGIYVLDPAIPSNSPFVAKLDLGAARRLYALLNSISIVRDQERTQSGLLVEIAGEMPDSVREALARDESFIRAVLALNTEAVIDFAENSLDTVDIRSIAYRKAQLSVMERLLSDREYFEGERVALGARGPEGVWQQFFERNQWIFGYGLSYIIGEGVDADRLEQVVAGHSVSHAGKRADALLRTRGALRSLCFVEIKHHGTKLLAPDRYRSGVWQPSQDLTAAVAQAQRTVQRAVEALGSHPAVQEVDGWESARYYNYLPRSVVVCGSHTEFLRDGAENEAMFSSFELYRRNLVSPEVLTFDELLERAQAIVRDTVSG